jgi:hypothetical protein
VIHFLSTVIDKNEQSTSVNRIGWLEFCEQRKGWEGYGLSPYLEINGCPAKAWPT